MRAMTGGRCRQRWAVKAAESTHVRRSGRCCIDLGGFHFGAAAVGRVPRAQPFTAFDLDDAGIVYGHFDRAETQTAQQLQNLSFGSGQ